MVQRTNWRNFSDVTIYKSVDQIKTTNEEWQNMQGPAMVESFYLLHTRRDKKRIMLPSEGQSHKSRAT